MSDLKRFSCVWRAAITALACAAAASTAAAQQDSPQSAVVSQQSQSSAASAQQNSPQSSVTGQQSQAAAPQAQTPPRPSSPAPVGLGGQVAPWLQLRGEFRGRLEGFSGGSYRPDNSDAYMLDRFRINAIVAPSKVAKFVVQVQDARVFDKTTGQMGVPFRDTIDLRMAYGELGGARNMVRAGRQELVFGEQRLIGHLNWVNNARSFDGVRATIARKPFKFDVFATSVVTIQPEEFDKSGSGNRLYGFYGSSTTFIPKATIEPYVFYRQSEGLTLETGGLGDIHQTTIGTRIAGKLPADFDYGIEMAAQTGSVATDDISAWAGHWIAGKTFSKAPSKPRPFVEFNYASGDSNPTDGVRGTFDQLYPTGHDKLGLADQVGWKNVDHVRGGVEFKPKAQWQVSGSYHSWWLASATDGLYSASGAQLARSAAGSAGRHVGQEIDAQMAFAYSPQLQISGGYAYLAPGEFLKNTTSGRRYIYPFVMVTYVFLGEQPAIGGRGTK